MDDFEGSILTDEDTGGFFSGDRIMEGDGALDAKVHKKIYGEEIAEIARLREALRPKHKTLGGRELNPEQRKRGLEILDCRLAVAEAVYRGDAMPVFETVKPIPESEPNLTPEPIILPWPKSARKPLSTRRPGETPRQAAKRLKWKTYLSDSPCKRSHIGPRFTQGGNCVECLNLWRSENIDRVRKYSRDSKRRAAARKKVEAAEKKGKAWEVARKWRAKKKAERESNKAV